MRLMQPASGRAITSGAGFVAQGRTYFHENVTATSGRDQRGILVRARAATCYGSARCALDRPQLEIVSTAKLGYQRVAN